MRIIRARPPNFHEILKAFPEAWQPGVIFAFGDTIYNPSNTEITPALLAHETVHSRQQGDYPLTWWDRYIASPEFRFAQELEAHRAEYRVAIGGLSRQRRRRILREIAGRLASALYGGLASEDEAKRLILQD